MPLLVRSRPTPRFVWAALLSLATLAGLVDVSIAQERASRSELRPDYRLLRQNEDWSAFRERPAERPTLKAVPLAAGGPFLTIGGEVRSYARWYRDERWGRGPARDGYLLQRVMLHGSVRQPFRSGPRARRERAGPRAHAPGPARNLRVLVVGRDAELRGDRSAFGHSSVTWPSPSLRLVLNSCNRKRLRANVGLHPGLKPPTIREKTGPVVVSDGFPPQSDGTPYGISTALTRQVAPPALDLPRP
jgi:hypothetical protein